MYICASERIRPSSKNFHRFIYIPRKVRKLVNLVVYKKEYFIAFRLVTPIKHFCLFFLKGKFESHDYHTKTILNIYLRCLLLAFRTAVHNFPLLFYDNIMRVPTITTCNMIQVSQSALLFM